MMKAIKSDQVNMLQVLIENAALGKQIDLHAKPVRETVQLERDGQEITTVILSMEYSGTLDDKPFKFKKNYSFADDAPQYALECLLIANNRLQMDYERLKDAGIEIDRDFFNLQNCFMGLPGDASVKSPALRLQDFVHLSRAGVPVSVNASLSRPVIVSRHEGVKKKGFGCIAAFSFTTGTEQATIEKLYGIGGYDDAKGDREDIVEVADKRLERDCERLRSAGIKVGKLSFPHIYERIFDK